jgi:D-3-phosphoglycerate dehydrogenase
MTVTDRPRVVVADPLAENGLGLLRQELDVVVAQEAEEVARALSDAEALIVRSRTQVTADLLDRGPALKLVARAGIGVDNIDVPAATARRVLVINAPLGNVQSTAEHTLALIFALARSIPSADRAVREGRWKKGYEGTQLEGKRLGVIGIGKVGRRVAALADAIGLEVVACDPYVPDEAWFSLPARRVDARELLTTADIVTLHVALSPETLNLIGADELATMKRGSYLVNCARGGLVDEDALVEALQQGHLAGAAIDVFRVEPLPADSPLLQFSNVILTPHVAASTREAQEQVSTEIATQVLDFFSGGTVAFPINPSVLREDQ